MNNAVFRTTDEPRNNHIRLSKSSREPCDSQGLGAPAGCQACASENHAVGSADEPSTEH